MRWSRIFATTAAALGAMAVLGIASGSGCSGDDSAAYGPGAGGTGASNAGGSQTGGSAGSGGSGIQLGGYGGVGDGGSTATGGDPCGGDPTCTNVSVGPPDNPFPLPSDDPPPDNVEAEGVTRDDDGYIVLDSMGAQFDFLWIADDLNYSVGFVSKVRTTPFDEEPYYREVGRYVSVTCFSDPVRGSKENIVLGQVPPAGLCADGMHGCCTRDELTPGPGGGHQPVQTIYNRPSRTAVDVNGDVWVSNRAHWISGYTQTSVTKIANNRKDCIDRNANGQIDTSSDVNNDGIITTDCDGNNLPDDIDTVCTAGESHEFYGLDDECVLFTVNLEWSGVGRPLALGPGDGGPTDPSDAWAGMFATGRFYRIDGKTGAIKETVQIQTIGGVVPNPYGAAIDSYGILWAPTNYYLPYLYYFDTNNPTDQGLVQNPLEGQHYGIAVDGYTDPNTSELIQQIWVGHLASSGACRYRPVRNQGFAGLDDGTWACAYFQDGVTRGRGIGVDNRTPTAFAWVALDGYPSPGYPGHIGRIPINIADSANTLLPNADAWATTQSMVTGAGVAHDQHAWAVSQDSSSVVHYGVDDTGELVSGPDVVELDDKEGEEETFCGHSYCKPHPYTYSDFTGFGLRNFTNPQGFYAWTESGNCPPGQTKFVEVRWDAETPPETAITMRARSAGEIAALDDAIWTGQYDASPANLLVAPGPLEPNPSSHLQVLFELTTEDPQATPKLKGFEITYRCVHIIPE